MTRAPLSGLSGPSNKAPETLPKSIWTCRHLSLTYLDDGPLSASIATTMFLIYPFFSSVSKRSYFLFS